MKKTLFDYVGTPLNTIGASHSTKKVVYRKRANRQGSTLRIIGLKMPGLPFTTGKQYGKMKKREEGIVLCRFS